MENKIIEIGNIVLEIISYISIAVACFMMGLMVGIIYF